MTPHFNDNEARVISAVDEAGADGLGEPPTWARPAMVRLENRNLIERRDGRLFITVEGRKAIGLEPADWQMQASHRGGAAVRITDIFDNVEEAQRAWKAMQFLTEHEGILGQALSDRREHMQGHAQRAKTEGEAVAKRPPREATPGTIDLTPTPAGYLQIAAMFTQEAEQAQKTREALIELLYPRGDRDG